MGIDANVARARRGRRRERATVAMATVRDVSRGRGRNLGDARDGGGARGGAMGKRAAGGVRFAILERRGGGDDDRASVGGAREGDARRGRADGCDFGGDGARDVDAERGERRRGDEFERRDAIGVDAGDVEGIGRR